MYIAHSFIDAIRYQIINSTNGKHGYAHIFITKTPQQWQLSHYYKFHTFDIGDSTHYEKVSNKTYPIAAVDRGWSTAVAEYAANSMHCKIKMP